VADAEFVVCLDHIEIRIECVGTLKVKADGEFSFLLCARNVVDRFDEYILRWSCKKIGALLGNSMDRLVEVASVRCNGKCDVCVTAFFCLSEHAFEEL